jgi:predicted regulator of Ras-like GTPase activity (Roadblock/LC7/MglB family)
VESILKDINAVVGVTGSFVCNQEGQVVARALPAVFDEATLSLVGRTATQTVAGLQTLRRRKAGDLDLLYGGGRVLVKNLRYGCLCILCVPRINVPLLNLTANVAARKLSAMLREQVSVPQPTPAQPDEADRPAPGAGEAPAEERSGLNRFLRPFGR